MAMNVPNKPFRGSGPGPQARDGCSVELYRRLAYAGEIECLAPFIPAGSSVLELGCGTGRLTRRLLLWGCEVTAVDNSAEMLTHAPVEARLVHADIETLDLKRRFATVLLPSCLINHADSGVRGAFLRAAVAHLHPSGQFMVERHDPYLLMRVEAGHTAQMQGGLTMRISAVARNGNVVDITLEYLDGTARWTHEFSVVPLDDGALQTELAGAGLGAPAWADPARRWAMVRKAA